MPTATQQDAVDVCVYEGERGSTEGNKLLGQFTISGIERAKRNVPKINVTFDLDTNGILKVTTIPHASTQRGRAWHVDTNPWRCFPPTHSR